MERSVIAADKGGTADRNSEGAASRDTLQQRSLEPADVESGVDDERARLRRAIREAHESAQAATRAKSEFLAMMSHEMRTPLNAVLGYTELLALGVPGEINDAQRGYIDRIRSASARLLSLINGVLDLTRIDSGRMAVAHERAPAEPIIERVLLLVAQQAEECGVQFKSRCGVDAQFLGDSRRVEQVVLQLLTNAIRFTKRGGTVTISCTQFGTPEADAVHGPNHRCWCAIRIEDTGIGIDEREISGIFDPFVQVESGRTRTYEGPGLGLAVGRRLARLMGGDLTVTSNPGTGSAFTLWLPAPPLVTGTEDTSGCSVPERRTQARHALGLIETADAILRDLDRLLHRLTARLRTDDVLDGATALDDTLLEEHTATLLTDVAQSLSIIEESEGEPTQLMRDAGDIQSLIANRHGAHRQGLGWTEDQLDREFNLLLEEVDRTLSSAHPGADGPSAVPGRDLVHGFLERGREESRRGYRRAAVGEPPERPPQDVGK
jgi:signal transduction histidine kinase